MDAGIHAAAVDGEAVDLFAKLRGSIFTALQLHAAALYDIGAAGLFIFKLGYIIRKLLCLALVILDLTGDLTEAGLRSGNVAFHALDRFAAAFDIGSENSCA